MMKKILLSLTFFCVALIGLSQDLDSLKQRILNLEQNQRSVQLNLDKAHDQFSTGTLIVIAGAATALSSFVLSDNKIGDGNNQNNHVPTLIWIGGALMTVGVVVQIDSHKWIGRAGRRRK